MINFYDFCYSLFSSVSKPLLRLCRWLENDLEAANFKLHPEVYASITLFIVVLSPIFTLLTYFALRLHQAFHLHTSRDVASLLLYLPKDGQFIIALIVTPILILLIGLFLPKIKASHRISGLKNEIPYASIYISVMTSGGLSPYISLLRLKRVDLLPRLKEEIKRIQSIVLSTGCDPISAMERAARSA